MKDFREYWTFLAVRGALTIIAAIGIVAAPLGAAAVLGVPVWLRLGIDFLATYLIIDATALIFLNLQLPARAKGSKALYAQAGIGLVAGVALYLMVYGVIGATSVVWLVAAQAWLSAVAEMFVARDTHREYGCLSCYATSMVLAACALALPFAGRLTAEDTLQVLAGYVALYGLSQFTVGARMLFLEYRSEHPATVASQAWRAAMDPIVATPAAAAPQVGFVRGTQRPAFLKTA